jgi:hypothetical protein
MEKLRTLSFQQKIKLAAFAALLFIGLGFGTWLAFQSKQSTSSTQTTKDTIASLQVSKTYAATPEADKATFLKQGMTTLGFSDPARQQNLTPEVVTSACLSSKSNEVRALVTRNARYYKIHTDEMAAMQHAAFMYCHQTYSADGKMPDMPAMHEH